MQLNFESEKFIEQIRSKEAIWNYKSNIYSDKEQRRSDWMAVCREMVPNFDDKTPTVQNALVTSFQRQWKVLRDGFLRSLKNIKSKGSAAKLYTYHNELLFMIELYDDHDIADIDLDIIGKDTKQEEGDITDATFETEAVSDADVVPIIKRRKRRNTQRRNPDAKKNIEPKAPSPTPEEALIEKITNYIENEERTKQSIENDEDKLFLLSLLSDFKNIPEALKLDAKFDILNVLRRYRNKEDSSTKASGSTRSKKSAAMTTTPNETNRFIYVKCEEEEYEED